MHLQFKLCTVYISGPVNCPKVHCTGVGKKHSISWPMSMRHLVVKFWNNISTYLFNVLLRETWAMKIGSSICQLTDDLKRVPLGLEAHKISWLISMRHLVVKFWTNTLTYLFDVLLWKTWAMKIGSSICQSTVDLWLLSCRNGCSMSFSIFFVTDISWELKLDDFS